MFGYWQHRFNLHVQTDIHKHIGTEDLLCVQTVLFCQEAWDYGIGFVALLH